MSKESKLSQEEQKMIDKSFEFGADSFYNIIEKARSKKLEYDCTAQEILYQVIAFLQIRGWSKKEILEFVDYAYKESVEETKKMESELSSKSPN